MATLKSNRGLGRVANLIQYINWYHHIKDHVIRLVIWPTLVLFSWITTKLWTLKHGSRSIQTSLILRWHPPQTMQMLKMLLIFATPVKSCYIAAISIKLSWKLWFLSIFKYITEMRKSLRVHMVWGDAISKLETFIDLEPCFKVHNLVVIQLKNTKLGQLTNLNMIFYIVCQFINKILLDQICNSPKVPCLILKWPITRLV